MAHGRSHDTGQAVRIAFAALTASLRLDEETATFYSDVIWVSLGKAARIALESLMESRHNWEFRSDFARKYTAIGRAEGEARGRAEGEAKALLRVLERRGIAVSPEQRARVLDCNQLEQLEIWLDRAIVAVSADDVFA